MQISGITSVSKSWEMGHGLGTGYVPADHCRGCANGPSAKKWENLQEYLKENSQIRTYLLQPEVTTELSGR